MELQTTTKNFNPNDIVVIYPFKQFIAGKRWLTKIKHIAYYSAYPDDSNEIQGYLVTGFSEIIKIIDIRLATNAEILEYKLLNISCIPLYNHE